MPLKSYIFAKDPVFEKCLADHAAHIVPGSRGQHVRKIQGAIEAIDGTPFDENEWSTMTYGPVTAKSVLDYKIARDIINRNYQQSADNVVGKMTIERLDEDMTALETSAKDSSSSRCEQRSTPSPTLLRAMAQGAGVQRRRPVENLPQTPDFLQSRGLIASGPVAPARSFGVGAPAGTIEIKKVGAAPTFGSDGYDDLAKFQMLPLGVTRQFTVSTFAVPCTIAIEFGQQSCAVRQHQGPRRPAA